MNWRAAIGNFPDLVSIFYGGVVKPIKGYFCVVYRFDRNALVWIVGGGDS